MRRRGQKPELGSSKWEVTALKRANCFWRKIGERRVEGERFEKIFYPEDGSSRFRQAFIAYLWNYIPSLLYNGYRVFAGAKGGRGVRLTTHLHLVSRSWKSRAITLLPLWVRVACYRVKLYLTLRKYMTPKPTGIACPLWHLVCYIPCDFNAFFFKVGVLFFLLKREFKFERVH